jgi:hypothetical protein
MSPELETLDQLVGGDLPATVIRDLFDNDEHFIQTMAAMLISGEIRLLEEKNEIPSSCWRQKLALACMNASRIGIEISTTDEGCHRIR